MVLTDGNDAGRIVLMPVVERASYHAHSAVLELLKKNVSLNQFPGSLLSQTCGDHHLFLRNCGMRTGSKWGSHTTDDHAPRVERLIWGVPPHEQLSFAGPYDVVLGSDVMYRHL
jgi:hypothetical protein